MIEDSDLVVTEELPLEQATFFVEGAEAQPVAFGDEDGSEVDPAVYLSLRGVWGHSREVQELLSLYLSAATARQQADLLREKADEADALAADLNRQRNA